MPPESQGRPGQGASQEPPHAANACDTSRIAPTLEGLQSPLLVGAVTGAVITGVSQSLFWKLHASGRLLRPVRLGRRTLWRRRELEEWIAAGCPPRDRWELIRGAVR